MKQKIDIQNLGLISYDNAMQVMTDLHAKRCLNQCANTLLVLQHTPVITKGRRLHNQEMALHPCLKELGVEVRNADRGGLLTYHGPGQIVIYFVLKLADYFEGPMQLVDFVSSVLIDFLKQHQVLAHVDPQHPGVWVGDKKIVSVGLRVEQGVTRHGIAFNVNNDLEVFKYFDPCGMSGECMASLQDVIKNKISDEAVIVIEEELSQCYLKALSVIKS